MGISIKQITGILIILWTLVLSGILTETFASTAENEYVSNIFDGIISHEDLKRIVHLTDGANLMSMTTDGDIILLLQ